MNSAGQEIVKLLMLCQTLQSEKDGVRRPTPGQYIVASDEELDDFAMTISRACSQAVQHDGLLKMHKDLSDIGKILEQKELIALHCGESYATKALEWIGKLVMGERS